MVGTQQMGGDASHEGNAKVQAVTILVGLVLLAST